MLGDKLYRNKLSELQTRIVFHDNFQTFFYIFSLLNRMLPRLFYEYPKLIFNADFTEIIVK